MKYRDVHPELVQFFGAWFHQDWDLEASDWDGVVASYRAEMGAWEAARTAHSLNHLLATSTDDELEAFLYTRLLCNFDPRAVDGLTVRAWLEDVSRHLRGHIGGGHAGPLDLEQIHRAVSQRIALATWPTEPTLHPAVPGKHTTQVGHFFIDSPWSSLGVSLWDRVAEVVVQPANDDEGLVTTLDGPTAEEVVEVTIDALRLFVR